MDSLLLFSRSFFSTIQDVFPIITIIVLFQVFVIRRPFQDLRKVIVGFIYVLVGLALFLDGLEQALFPLGAAMAQQLTDPSFLNNSAMQHSVEFLWKDYKWAYLFGAAIGFSTTIAEPALIAVAIKANQISGGVISAWGLRIAVAIGVAIGITLGIFRIVSGWPLAYFIISAYLVVLLQTIFAPRTIIPLAYDSGGVTTSTVTVPLVAALGLGLADAIPGRSPLIDGFGLIAFASVFPIIAVMAYGSLAQWQSRRNNSGQDEK